MIFKTERLRVRHLRTDHLDGYFDLHGNINVMLYTTGVALTFEQSNADLKRMIDYYFSKKDFRVWAIETIDNGVFVGTCSLIHNDDEENEIGYRFRQAYWENGFG